MDKKEEHEYVAVYRCRMCGKVFTTSSIVTDRLNAAGILCALGRMEEVFPGGGGIGMGRTACHTCRNGDEGLGVLMGLRLRENEERASLLDESGFE